MASETVEKMEEPQNTTESAVPADAVTSSESDNGTGNVPETEAANNAAPVAEDTEAVAESAAPIAEVSDAETTDTVEDQEVDTAEGSDATEEAAEVVAEATEEAPEAHN